MFLQGELGGAHFAGQTFARTRSALDVVMDGFVVDCYLLGAALLFGVLAGLAAGALQATRPRSLPSRAITVVTALTLSAPVYWVGLFTLLLFAPGIGSIVQIPFLSTVSGYRDPLEDPAGFLHGLWLPALIVGAPLAAACTRMCASQLRSTLHEDFVRTAHGKGVKARRVVWRHALPAAAGPVVALVGVNMNLILTNLALIEAVFNIPGGFRYIERALINRDVDLVQALVVEATLFIVVANFLADRSTPGWTRGFAPASRSERKKPRARALGLTCAEPELPPSSPRSRPHWPPQRRLPPPSLLSTSVNVPSAVARDCQAKLLDSGGGYAQKTITLPAAGLAGARLDAPGGDWDLAVFDKRSGRTVAASAGFGARELAEGFAGGGRELVIQACRRSGSAASASLSAFSVAVSAGTKAQRASLVRVQTPTPASKTLLNTLGLDLTEHGRNGFVDVVSYGAGDLAKLRDAGLAYTTVVADLTAQARSDRAADRAFARRVGTSGLPSGRTGYRHLYDYEAEMKALAAASPNLVKPITLNHPTLEGRQVHGIEITSNVQSSDGKPVFLQMGVHHAREWPSGEHAMEWAFELVRGYGRNAQITNLVRKVRTIVIPVVNVDGFNLSREAPVDLVEDPEFESLPALTDTAAALVDPAFAYKRRNCRVIDGQDAPGGICALPTFRTSGVDVNRNYGGLWGGPGASALPLYDTYRGAGPFSEPESQNIRELISSRQVTTLITNHTFSNLVLRPPGVRAQGPPPDEQIYAALGARMAAQNGYTNQPSYALYDTTGTTEDWSYYATGGLGYTFEIGSEFFHPAYEKTIAEYRGAGALAGKGNRGAYLLAMQNAADVSKHARITGSAPAGAKLTLSKQFVTETSPVEPAQTDVVDGVPSPQGPKQTFVDHLRTNLDGPCERQLRVVDQPVDSPGGDGEADADGVGHAEPRGDV